MRQSHLAGEKLFVDYAGDTVPVIVDRLTGQRRGAQIFVAVLGASNFLYAEATWTQTLGDWIEAHNRALIAIGGVPALLVPDNTKVAVIKACLYDPVINRTYGSASELWPRVLTDFGPASVPQPRVCPVLPGGSEWIGKPEWNCSSSSVRSMSSASARSPVWAAKFGVHRRMVRQAIAGALPLPHRYPARGSNPSWMRLRRSSTRCWTKDRRAPRKQRHTARRIYRRILTEFPDAGCR